MDENLLIFAGATVAIILVGLFASPVMAWFGIEIGYDSDGGGCDGGDGGGD